MASTEERERSARRLQPWVYLALLVGAIPWYWSRGEPAIWAGVPDWVFVAIAVSTAVSIYTAVQLRRPWPTERTDEHASAPREEP